MTIFQITDKIIDQAKEIDTAILFQILVTKDEVANKLESLIQSNDKEEAIRKITKYITSLRKRT